MTALFITILNMSITASIVALAVIIVRIPLKKAPKIFSYALWGVVLFRLICPFSFESQLSFIPFNQSSIRWYSSGFENGQSSIVEDNVSFVSALTAAYWAVGDAFNGGLGSISVTTDSVPEGYKNAFHSEVWLIFGSYIWLFGFIALLLYAIIGYIRLKRRLYYATLLRDNIYETDKINTPFVFGFIYPKIYMPIGIEPSQHNYIVKHEQTHIKRRDYIIKPLAFIVFALHWFNPLMWVAYLLMSKDMEMSCDESVLKETDEDIRGLYSHSLLHLSVKRVSLLSSLAFGESDVKSRVKNVISFKKPAKWLLVISYISVLVFIIGFSFNRINIPIGNINIANDDTTRDGELYFYSLKAAEIDFINLSCEMDADSANINDTKTIEDILNVLRTVVVFSDGDFNREYEAKYAQYDLTMQSGEIINIGTFGDFININGQFYRTANEYSEELNYLGTQILNNGDYS